MRNFCLGLLMLLASLVPAQAQPQARTILIVNDDGLTSNVVALHDALVADGHEVIVSVPCHNQSGMGAATYIGRPLPPLAAACENGAAPVGAPAVGPMTYADLGPDYHYVDGTPVMALMYGLDVLATERWGAAPDLVLSGPNEGNNAGPLILGSGTVSAAQAAALRGLSAVALSAAGNTAGTPASNPRSVVVAQLTLELVRQLDEQSGGGRMLPVGLALNVNFPDEPAEAPWRRTTIGTYDGYAIDFVADLAVDPSPLMSAMAEARGFTLPALPGIAIDRNRTEPTEAQAHDEAVVLRSAITVSPMQAGYAHFSSFDFNVGGLLEDESSTD